MVQIEGIRLDNWQGTGARKSPGAPDRTTKSKLCTREEPMARRHGSTAGQRVAWVSQLLGGSGTYGLVTLLSREAGVSRQTLYVWAEQGRAALEQAFQPREAERTITPELERQAVGLLVEAHAAGPGIQ